MSRKELVICVIIITVCMLYALLTSNSIGVSKSYLEKDARKSQHIPDTWEVSKMVTDNIGAMIFYNKEKSDAICSIYLNHKGMSFGYFFNLGGSLGDGIEGIEYKEYGMVIVSMNEEHVWKIELDDGNKIETINVEPNSPFAVVIPNDCKEVTVYDIHHNEVPIEIINIIN